MSATPLLAYVTLSSPQPQRLIAFYSGLVGTEVIFDRAPYTVIGATDRPVCIAFQQVQSETASTPVHIDFHVADLDVACARVEELGGRLGDRHLEVGSLWRQAFDPDGNVFCLLSRPPSGDGSESEDGDEGSAHDSGA